MKYVFMDHTRLQYIDQLLWSYVNSRVSINYLSFLNTVIIFFTKIYYFKRKQVKSVLEIQYKLAVLCDAWASSVASSRASVPGLEHSPSWLQTGDDRAGVASKPGINKMPPFLEHARGGGGRRPECSPPPV